MSNLRRSAFTLIELLVVISIIALLIAILLPILSKARLSSMDTQCLINMRSLMQAQTAYAVDNDGDFADRSEWIWGRNNLPDGTPFRRFAVDYTTPDAPLQGTLNTYVTDTNAHFCPVAPIMPVTGMKYGDAPLGDKVVRSYVQSNRVHPDGYTMDNVSKPSELLMLTEENTFSMNFKGMPGFKQQKGPHPMNDGALSEIWDSIGSIHNRRDADNLRSGYASGAFLDGSVDWVFSQGMVYPPGPQIYNATAAFMRDDVPNPEGQDPRFIDDSDDYSFTY